MSFTQWISAAVLAVTLALPALAHGDSQSTRLAQFEQYAGKPVAQIRYFQLLNYETLSDDTIAVWKGVNKVFLIKVLPPCQGLQFANAMHLTNSMTHVFTQKFDHVIFADQRCAIAWIKPVDYKAMRAAKRAAKNATADHPK